MFARLNYPDGHLVPIRTEDINKYCVDLVLANWKKIQIITPGDYFLMSPQHKHAKHFFTYVSLRVFGPSLAEVKYTPADGDVIISKDAGHTYENFISSQVFFLTPQTPLLMVSSVNSNLVNHRKYIARIYDIVVYLPG